MTFTVNQYHFAIAQFQFRSAPPDMAGDNKNLMQRWFNVIHEKSQLFRYESELMVRAKELELEDRHARSVVHLVL